MSEKAARDAVGDAQRLTGLPTTDVLRFGVGGLLEAVLGGRSPPPRPAAG
jgi:uncharacterized NAD-dependent epimerase/dehydratase family protein